MITVSDIDLRHGLEPGSHVCWIVADPSAYVEVGTALLRAARDVNEKPVVFGPAGAARDALAGPAMIVADPREAFLGGRDLDPEAMFAMFEEQTAMARSEGFRGVRVLADMDWLLPLGTSREDVQAFELLLDRRATELNATIVCMYRTESFDASALTAASCVHPIDAGHAPVAQFKLVAGPDDSWRLFGEVDLAVATQFDAAITTAIAAGECVIDASELDFLDIAGMRRVAQAASRSGTAVTISGVRPIVRRGWDAARFGDIAPSVRFVA